MAPKFLYQMNIFERKGGKKSPVLINVHVVLLAIFEK